MGVTRLVWCRMRRAGAQGWHAGLAGDVAAECGRECVCGSSDGGACAGSCGDAVRDGVDGGSASAALRSKVN